MITSGDFYMSIPVLLTVAQFNVMREGSELWKLSFPINLASWGCFCQLHSAIEILIYYKYFVCELCLFSFFFCAYVLFSFVESHGVLCFIVSNLSSGPWQKLSDRLFLRDYKGKPFELCVMITQPPSSFCTLLSVPLGIGKAKLQFVFSH